MDNPQSLHGLGGQSCATMCMASCTGICTCIVCIFAGNRAHDVRVASNLWCVENKECPLPTSWAHVENHSFSQQRAFYVLQKAWEHSGDIFLHIPSFGPGGVMMLAMAPREHHWIKLQGSRKIWLLEHAAMDVYEHETPTHRLEQTNSLMAR